MSEFVSTHQPCPCGESSDAFAIREDGGGYCFSCSKNYKGDQTLEDGFSYQYIDWRGVSKDTFAKFRSLTKIDDRSGEPIAIAYRYPNDALKVRSIKEKQFHSVGDMRNAHLFGSNVFPAGSADSIIITEGELDAHSAYQILAKPAVSVRSSSTAFSDCRAEFDYLNSFNRIYLALDNDGPGQEATKRIAAMFDNQKVYHVKLTGLKDANEFLAQGREAEFRNLVFYARRFIPSEIVSSFAEIQKLLEEEKAKEIVSYPFKNLQEMTQGIRRGIVLITAPEGIGKTEILRAIETHILRTTDLNIGIIHLEEAGQRSVQGLAGYQLGEPIHLPGSYISIDGQLSAYRGLVKRDERVHIINHLDNDDPQGCLDLIRFLVAVCSCKVVFLDHITYIVSGIEEGDERRKLDYLSTKLEKMTEELDFSLIMVSHVNDDGKTRGSRNIGKVSNVRIDLSRDILSPDPIERNKTFLTISKNRDAAKTGPAGILYFDPETFIVSDFDEKTIFVPG